MRRAHKPAKKYIELLPEALLPFEKEWQAISYKALRATAAGARFYEKRISIAQSDERRVSEEHAL